MSPLWPVKECFLMVPVGKPEKFIVFSFLYLRVISRLQSLKAFQVMNFQRTPI